MLDLDITHMVIHCQSNIVRYLSMLRVYLLRALLLILYTFHIQVLSITRPSRNVQL
jgi:hypothetical protein